MRKNTEFYTEAGADWVIFRGVKLHIIQSVDDYRINDKVVFMYVNDPNGEISVEQRLAVFYELQESYPYHNMMVCIRGVKSTVDINSMYHAHYFRDLNVLQYRSGFSKLLTEQEKEQKICLFYFSPEKETREGRQFVRKDICELICKQPRQRLVSAV